MSILTEDQEDTLNNAVVRALGGDFQEEAKKLVAKLVDDIGYRLFDYIDDDLTNGLQDAIRQEAARAAESFIAAIANGNEEAALKFIQARSDHLNNLERGQPATPWLKFARENGSIALRSKMLEFVGPKLEAERIKDLEAEVAALRKLANKQEAELHGWRSGMKVLGVAEQPI